MAQCKGLTPVTPVGFVSRQHYWVSDYLVTSTYRQQLSLCCPLLTEQKHTGLQRMKWLYLTLDTTAPLTVKGVK